MQQPLGPASVSLGLSAGPGTGREVVERLSVDAVAAVGAGFDGVTLSEHHGGFPHYVPGPLLLAGILLARLPHGFACASPTILPLRNPVTVAEDLAWLDAAYPGRVAAGFVPGYQRSDFEAVGADFDDRQRAFWAGLETVTTTLGRGEQPSAVRRDAAIASLPPDSVPVLAGVGGPVGVRRAARLGAGLLITSLRPAAEARDLVTLHRDAGGTGPAVLIRRVHIGDHAAGFATSMGDWRGAASAGAGWLQADDSALLAGPAEAVAEALAEAVTTSGSTALNLRLDTATHDPERTRDQVATLGAEVLPLLRKALGWKADLT